MATFKVGQRVRILPGRVEKWCDEGIVVAHDPAGTLWEPDAVWVVRADNHPSLAWNGLGPGCWWCFPHELAPLTDPKADAFIESLKKLAREPQPLKETA